MADVNIGIVGAGIIGLTHIETIRRTPGFRLSGIVDPGPRTPEIAAAQQVPLFENVEAMIALGNVDGVIVATPNELHVPVSTTLIEAGIPVLLEKPIANTVEEALQLLAVADRTGIPLLVGHHRRHNPIIRAAKKAISEGSIGRLVTASVICTLYKGDDYFGAAWRVQPGVGGPLLINLIHEIDLMHHFFGDVASVSAASSNAMRGLAVEDTAAAILQFENGGIASLAVSDTAVGPWAWDLSAGENTERFPAHPVQSHFLSGTEGGLSLPDLAHWSHAGEKSWNHELRRKILPLAAEDPYGAQIRHFGAVIAGKESPLVSGLEATKNLATIDAIRKAAESGCVTPVRSFAKDQPAGREASS
ncbi:Gfo/Idh/MocA family oxidoreductase [Aquamicrobium sp. LC103]|uniref:Gfo/Idh/MocA family protein n=1 Tax=Aquamicrobium sp. LC103 TaxID=1120658 RepID=UPI00063EB457|nr:Gfo/Idh/MocA family oxidoreductase [Aquamicrobium sp. LC103]TKT76190.1 Gfo/Idh/MocA family oxidoreductase [Aquamicrobium sp. LC103]